MSSRQYLHFLVCGKLLTAAPLAEGWGEDLSRADTRRQAHCALSQWKEHLVDAHWLLQLMHA